MDGRGEAQIYLADGVEYKFVVEDSKGALIYTQEPVYGAIWPNAEQWPSDATLSYKYMSEAKAAVDSMGVTRAPFDTYAQAANALPDLIEGERIEVSIDETRERARTRYKVEGGSLVFIVNLDQLRQDLSDKDQGSRLIKTPHGDALSDAVPWVTPFAFGAKADGDFDDGRAIADAKALGLVLMPKGDYRDTGNGQFYVYTNELKSKGGALRYSWGSQSEPITDFRPVKMVEKFSSVRRDAAGSNGWDVGGIYSVVHKIDGDAFVAGVTSQVRSINGSGECIALHGRASGVSPNVSEIFGAWAYADINPSDGTKIFQAVGFEINLRNQGAIPSLNPNLDEIPTGNYRGLIVNTADGSKPCHVGVDVGTQVSNGSLGWYRAIQVRQNGVYPTASAGFDTFAIGIEGGSSGANRYGGIRLGRGSYTYGISMLDVDGSISNNAAIVLRHGHKIQWGSLTTSNYVTVSEDAASLLNLNGLSLAIGGVKVVGQQRPAIPNAVAGSEITTLNLVLSAMRNHGLIAV